jgi:hypothetical protein
LVPTGNVRYEPEDSTTNPTNGSELSSSVEIGRALGQFPATPGFLNHKLLQRLNRLRNLSENNYNPPIPKGQEPIKSAKESAEVFLACAYPPSLPERISLSDSNEEAEEASSFERAAKPRVRGLLPAPRVQQEVRSAKDYAPFPDGSVVVEVRDFSLNVCVLMRQFPSGEMIPLEQEGA